MSERYLPVTSSEARRKMAARSSKGKASQAGFALSAASMAALTWSGVAAAYSAMVSWWLQGFFCLRVLLLATWNSSGVCSREVRNETYSRAADLYGDVDGELALELLDALSELRSLGGALGIVELELILVN